MDQRTCEEARSRGRSVRSYPNEEARRAWTPMIGSSPAAPAADSSERTTSHPGPGDGALPGCIGSLPRRTLPPGYGERRRGAAPVSSATRLRAARSWSATMSACIGVRRIESRELPHGCRRKGIPAIEWPAYEWTGEGERDGPAADERMSRNSLSKRRRSPRRSNHGVQPTSACSHRLPNRQRSSTTPRSPRTPRTPRNISLGGLGGQTR
jgi:hypothetical protein